GSLDPGLRLIQPRLPDKHSSNYQAREGGTRLVRPAVLLGQLDRLPAVFRGPGSRSVELDDRRIDQAGELQIGTPDPSRQRDALVQVALGVLEPGGPVLRAADADQR